MKGPRERSEAPPLTAAARRRLQTCRDVRPAMKGGLERWTEKLGSAVSALGATAVSGAQVLGKKLQQEALGAQCLLEYAVAPHPSATGGAAGLWRIYTARSKKEGELSGGRKAGTEAAHVASCVLLASCDVLRLCLPHSPLTPAAASSSRAAGSPHPLVSAWVLDKRQLTQTEEQLYGGGGGGGGGGGLTRPSQRRLDAFLEQQRHDVQALTRLKREAGEEAWGRAGPRQAWARRRRCSTPASPLRSRAAFVCRAALTPRAALMPRPPPACRPGRAAADCPAGGDAHAARVHH
jgi:hypothetical protein